MAALAVIIVAIARSSWRDLRSLRSIAGNNVLWAIALMGPGSAFPLFVIAILFLFPLSADVLRHLPSHRTQLWPLSRWQRTAVSVAALLLNPMVIIAVVFAAVTRSVLIAILLLVAAAIVQMLLAAAEHLLHRFPKLNLIRYVPRLPGNLGGLTQSHMRQLIGALDIYLAAVLAVGGAVYRFASANPDPMAPTVIGLLVVGFLSTLAQCQLGFDSEAERDRYRLLPLSGVQILFAKDIAWLILMIILTSPLDILPCVAAGASALAVGHRTATDEPIQQRRWRFAAGRLYPNGLIQMAGIGASGVAVHHFGWLMLTPFVAAYAVSLWWYGRKIYR